MSEPISTEGIIGAGQPCWVIAVDPQGTGWEPLMEIHQVNRLLAYHVAVAVASTIGLDRILYGEHEQCAARKHGGTMVAIRYPRVIEKPQPNGTPN